VGASRNVSEREFEQLLDELPALPEFDLSLHAELPKRLSPGARAFLRRVRRGRSGRRRGALRRAARGDRHAARARPARSRCGSAAAGSTPSSPRRPSFDLASESRELVGANLLARPARPGAAFVSAAEADPPPARPDPLPQGVDSGAHERGPVPGQGPPGRRHQALVGGLEGARRLGAGDARGARRRGPRPVLLAALARGRLRAKCPSCGRRSRAASTTITRC
jgi:hypothetical protein